MEIPIDIIKTLLCLLSKTTPIHALAFSSVCKSITDNDVRKNLYDQILLRKYYSPILKELVDKTFYINVFMENNPHVDFENQIKALAITSQYSYPLLPYIQDKYYKNNGWFIRAIYRVSGNSYFISTSLTEPDKFYCGNICPSLQMCVANYKFNFIQNDVWKSSVFYYFPSSQKYYDTRINRELTFQM